MKRGPKPGTEPKPGPGAKRAARRGKKRRRWPRRATATPEDDPGADEAGPDEPEEGPLRRCIVTRERGERARMLRFVVAPDRTIVPDLHARLPGRGIWLSARRDVLDTARKRGAFNRAARGTVLVPPDLTLLVEAGLLRRVTELLGLARRAGQAVSGFQKAREWLGAGRAGLVVQAVDGSPEERRRFLSGARDVPVVAPLDAAALGSVFGRDHVVHVAVAAGRLAEALVIEAGRLAGVAAKLPPDKTVPEKMAPETLVAETLVAGGRAAERPGTEVPGQDTGVGRA